MGLGDVLGRILVGSTSGQLLSLDLTNPPQATERPTTLQSQESRNAGSVFTIALGHKPTEQCYEIV